MVTQWLTNGTLGDKVVEKNKIYEDNNQQAKAEGRLKDIQTVGLQIFHIRHYLRDMLKALHYCHKVAKVIHRDIKPDNIGINHNGEAVLIDFGVCADLTGRKDDKLDQNMGSYMFFAPEMLMRNREGARDVHGEMTDIWALGVTFFYLLTGRYPWQTKNADSLLQLKEIILLKEIDFTLIKNAQVRNLMRQILCKDPANRITMDEILEDPWVTNNGIDKLDPN